MMSNPDSSIIGKQKLTEVLDQLMKAVKCSSVQRQQKVLALMKANPPLMAIFKKQTAERKKQERQKQQQQRKMLLNEGNVTGNKRMRSHQRLQNSDPSTIGMKKPTTAWTQLLDTLKSRESAEKKQKVLDILKANPPLMDAFTKQSGEKQRQLLQQQQKHVLINEGNIIENQTVYPRQIFPNSKRPISLIKIPAEDCVQSLENLNSPPSTRLQIVTVLNVNHPQFMSSFMQQKQLLQQKNRQMLQSEYNITEDKMRPCQVLPNKNRSIDSMQRSTQVWNELPETLKSPTSAEQQQRILTILKANPQLAAAFIKQRTAQKQQQQRLKLLKQGTPNIKTDNELLDGRSIDATIEVKRRKFNCHKCILGAQSPIFSDIMERDMKRKTSNNVTTDSESTKFKEFLLYLYTGSKKHLSWKNIIDRYKLANKYCVGNLEKLCGEYIEKNLTTENFYDFFLLSQMHNDREIIDITTRFFLKNSKEITESRKWAEFLAENPTEGDELIEALNRKC